MRQTYVNSSLAQVFRSQQRRPRPKTPASEEGGPRPETSERHTGAGSEEDRFVFDQHRISCLYGARRTIKQSNRTFPMHRCIGTQEWGCRQQGNYRRDLRLVTTHTTGKNTRDVALRRGSNVPPGLPRLHGGSTPLHPDRSRNAEAIAAPT